METSVLEPRENQVEKDRIYELYLEACFNQTNILTEEQYRKVCLEYDNLYEKVLPRDKNAKILDLGCGAGHFLYYLSRKGYQNFLGIDISAQQVEYCKTNISKNVELADAFYFLENKKQLYSFITAHDILEHIPKKNLTLLLRLIYQAMEKDGVLIIRVPNMSNPFSLVSRYGDFTHEIGFTEKSLFQLLCTTGFRDIEIFSPAIRIRSFRRRIRGLLIEIVYKVIQYLYYIQDFSVPKNLGKNLIVICRKE